MPSDDNVLTPSLLRARAYVDIFVILSLALGVRVLLYYLMYLSGYFYGIPWDTFSRTDLAWQWAQRPYFFPSDGYWMPLQFWLVGATYVVLHPWIDTANILVPVVINNLFFAGSLVVTCLSAQRIGGRTGLYWAALFATLFPADILISYSALAEPIYIFFILLSSYIFANCLQSTGREHARGTVWASAATLFATATHYVGWFLSLFMAIFAGNHAIRSAMNKDIMRAALYAGSTLLCILFPALWLINNSLIWNDPLHFTRIASSLQASYVGGLPIEQRLVIPFQVLLTSLPTLSMPGLVAIVYVVRKDLWQRAYLAPIVFVFLLLSMSTLFAFSAPYQEPRYMVLFGWVMLPYLAAGITLAWKKRTLWVRVVLVSVIIAIIAINLFETFHFSNSFGPDVREVANTAGQWLKSQPDKARVVIQADSFAERGVIPVVAGYPDRFVVIDSTQMRDPNQYFVNAKDALVNEQLVILKDRQSIDQLYSNGTHLEQVGPYLLLFAGPNK